MHVCFITNEYPEANHPHGGIGTFVQTLGRALVREGWKVQVIGFGGTLDASEDQGVLITRLAESYWPVGRFIDNSFRLRRALQKIHQQHPLDVIETAEAGLAFLPKIPGVKQIVRLHGGHHFFSEAEHRRINPWKGWQEKKSISRADAIIAVSNYVAQHSARYFDFSKKPLVQIPYPIDTQLFRPMPEIPVVKGKIVFAGTFCEKKGVRQLLEAMPLVCQAFPDAHLELYGRDWHYPDGRSYLAEMRQLLQQMPPFPVQFMGAVPHDDLPKKFARAEVCVFPSHMETQGLVAPEAMAMGKAVVFTRLGPGPETIVHGVTGRLCDPYLPRDIAEQVMVILGDKEAALGMGVMAREAVVGKFDVEGVVKENMRVYAPARITGGMNRKSRLDSIK